MDVHDTEGIIAAVKAIAPTFGGINLEDIASPKCFEIEERLKAELDIPVMHDDQHGTAVVVLAGLINSLKLRKSKVKDVKIIVNGAGSAGLAIVDLLLIYGFKNIIVIDSKGAIYEGREDLNEEKQKIAKESNKEKIKGNLEEVIKNKDIFIGVSKAKVLTEKMIRTMSPKPIIFALANPEP